MTMYKTAWRKTPAGTYLRAEFGEHKIGTQAPYASVGGLEASQASEHDRFFLAGGCLHELIAGVFPELKPLIQFHLGTAGISMHYEANAVYWRDMALGFVEQRAYDPEPRATLADHINVSVDGADVDVLLSLDKAEFYAALAARIPTLQAAYAAVDIAAMVKATEAVEARS